MYESKRFPYDGTIDADGHVLEPAWLWERYLEPEFRERAIRIRTDADGLEYLELDGRPSERTIKGVLGLLGAMRRRRPALPRTPLRRPHSPTVRDPTPSAWRCSSARTSTRPYLPHDPAALG